MIYYAHTAEDEEGRRLPPESGKWQLLRDHLRNVATLAKKFAAPMGSAAAAEAYLAGLLHDLGKYQPDFQRYLAHGSPRTPHAIHGGAVLASIRHLANLVASHHSGLHDEDDSHAANLNRLIGTPEGRTCLQALLSSYRADGLPLPPKPAVPTNTDVGDAAEDLRLRLLLSALADADYLDTEEHFLRAAKKTRPFSAFATISELRVKLDAHLSALAQRAQSTSLNQLRTRIAAHCAEAGATSSAGTFSLAVPTGGGKTLASAAFALHHAASLGFSRVIYVIPYTSIIEQNARVFASIFGAENVLEHHSLADWQSAEDDAAPDSLAARSKLAAENWDAPFIITTNVQFFESLHSHRPSAVRKLHRLLGAVVIFDECQTFPPELLDPSLITLQALQTYGKTSFVFCTATQPAFARRDFFPAGFPAITEIIPADTSWRLHERPEFRRTRIHHDPAPVSLATFAQRIARYDRALAIVNTRRTARELFDAVQLLRSDAHIYHLSTLMCPAHRQAVLGAIRDDLACSDQGCLVIATQLIEAGVDLDFPHVFRVLGPLDSILQAAGRCNREGHLTDATGQPTHGTVEIVTLADATLPPGVYQRATALAAKFLPSAENGDITPDAIREYFHELYHSTQRDKHNIADLRANRLYRAVGLSYRWIDEEEPTESVLTDYDPDAHAWLSTLEAQDYQPPTRRQRRALAHLSLNLRASEVKRGERAGILRRLHCGVYVTQKSYDPCFGYNPAGVLGSEHTII
jgi:CRISPR-associated endonuclease/helicase Cas3